MDPMNAFLSSSCAATAVLVTCIIAIGTENCTDMQEKAKARLCELAPAARGSQEAGFTQPRLHLFLHICITNLQCAILITWVLLPDPA